MFTHLTSSPHHPKGNGEAERAVQTVKNLLEKGGDPYVALLNYRAIPLQQGSSPAELLMGRKLRTRIPAPPSSHVPSLPDVVQFREVDAQLKAQRKVNFDKRHRARPLPPLSPGDRVWIKTPRDAEAQVVKPLSPSPRHCTVQTSTGTWSRRNRHHLRRRGDLTGPQTSYVPRSTSTLLPDQTSEKPQTETSSDHPEQEPPSASSDATPPEGVIRTSSQAS